PRFTRGIGQTPSGFDSTLVRCRACWPMFDRNGPLEALAQHALDALLIAFVQLTVVQQIALTVAVFLAHQMVQARLHAHQLACAGLAEPLDYGLAGLDLCFAHSVSILARLLCRAPLEAVGTNS